MTWNTTQVTACLAILCLSGGGAQAQEPAPGDAKNKSLPLVPARAINIDTDEGTWISADVSPDAKTIVFDLLGDLYAVPLTGGPTTPLTSGMAFDAQPRFSPDGKWVVFTSDRDGAENIWILNVDTKETRQITGQRDKSIESPEWTPDGKYVVATVGDLLPFLRPGKLWLYNVAGGTGVQLIKDTSGGDPSDGLLTIGAAFGRDGRYIWYAQRNATWQYNAIFPQFQIALYDRESGRSEVRTSRYGSAIRPTLSPDGRWMVYASRYEARTGLVLRDLESGEEKWLAYPVERDEQEAVPSRDAYPGMAFTPDSKELVATYGGKIWRIPTAGGAPIPVPFRVQTRVELGPLLAFKYPITDSAELTARQVRDAVPSPDGKRLAFVALDRLYVMDFPAGTPRRLSHLNVVETQPVWSPDGAWIAYATWSRDGGLLYKVRVDGTQPPVAFNQKRATYQTPAWSPDGSRLVAVRGSALAKRQSEMGAFGPYASGQEAVELVSIPAAGGPASLIAPTFGRLHPHFSSDPSRIFLWAGDNGLVSIRWDGSDEKRHIAVTAPILLNRDKPEAPSLVIMAPRGDQALVQTGFDLYVVTVAQVGAEPPTISLEDPKNAVMPARRLTDIGGEFPAWSSDGHKVHWTLGNAHVIYDLDSAAAFDRRLEEAQKAKPDSSSPARYQPPEARIVVRYRRDIPQGTVVLRGGQVITMRGAEVLENADIVVRNNRIVSVGPRGAAPEGARVFDLSGTTILPGFVDLHLHTVAAWGLHTEQPWMHLANLAYGVTTSRDPQTITTDVLSYQDMVESGVIIGPRIYSTGPGIGQWLEPLRDLDHARQVVKRYSSYYDTKFIKMYIKGNRQTRQWVVIAAKEAGMLATTEGDVDAKYDLTMALDGYPGQEHAIPTVPLYQDLVTLYAESGIVYTPTLLVQYGGPWAEEWFFQRERPYDDPKVRRFMPYEELARKTRRRGAGAGPGPGHWFMEDEYIFPQTAKGAADILRAGGKVGVGSHGEFQGLGYHWELWAIATGGMQAHDVLRIATLGGAEAMGLDGDLGSLAPGKLADLIVLNRNPLENLRNTNSIRYVMKNGRLYDGGTVDEIWPTPRKQTPPFGLPEIPRTAAGEKK